MTREVEVNVCQSAISTYVMWKTTELTTRIGLQYPIIQAPMAGGATTAELVAAVSNGGALGSLGAGYMSADDIKQTIKAIRRLTDRPFAVNLFIPESHKATADQIQTACDTINQYAAELNIKTEAMLGPYAPSFDEQVRVLIEEKVPVFSFTFGMLDRTLIREFKKYNAILIGTATTLAEANMLQESGIDAIVAQGSEAGGHRGSFLESAENSLIPLRTLVSELKDNISVAIIASGGMMQGHDIAKLIHAGASGAQLGTAFLCCHEAGIHPQYKLALLDQKQDNTVLTSAFSGKLARGINNKFIQHMQTATASIVDYPIQNKLTGLMRQAAKAQDNVAYMSMWSGSSAYLARNLHASTLLEVLVSEADAYVRSLSTL